MIKLICSHNAANYSTDSHMPRKNFGTFANFISPLDDLIYVVQFKHGLKLYGKPLSSREVFHVNDFVVVEADRGEDLGQIKYIIPEAISPIT